MKVFCDACGTKYSIADDRIAGKAFKLRCKNCDHLIIKRAPRAPVAEAVAAPVAEVVSAPMAAPADWHVVIDGAHRPIALVELHRLRAAGELDDAALVWREGFDDWRELGTIDELCVAAPSIEAAPEAAPAVPPAGAHPVLRNERNETSVLFSLGKLATLAAPARTAAPAAGGEGSGLLDIRSIARTLAPAVTRARTERAGLDDLPIYGPVMFAEPAVFPRPPRGRDRRLVWALAASSGMLAIVTAILVVIMMRDHGSAHAGELPATPRATPMPAQPAHPATPAEPPARSATATPPAAPTTASPGAATATSPGAPTASAPAWPRASATAQAGDPPPPPVRPASAASRRASTHASVPPVGSVPSAPSVASGQHAEPIQPVASAAQPVASAPPVASLQPRRAAESCSEVTCIVNSYADPCCAIYRSRDDSHVPPPPDPALPDSLDHPAIVAGLARIDTRGCRDQSSAHGDVTVSIKVSPAGAVATVVIKSSPDPALGACVEAAARKGTFGPTQRGGSFAYVWRF